MRQQCSARKSIGTAIAKLSFPILALFFSTADATSTTWTNLQGNGDWNNSRNWTNGVLPASNIDADILSKQGHWPVISGGTAAANTITLFNSGVGPIGSLTVQSSATLTVYGAGGISLGTNNVSDEVYLGILNSTLETDSISIGYGSYVSQSTSTVKGYSSQYSLNISIDGGGGVPYYTLGSGSLSFGTMTLSGGGTDALFQWQGGSISTNSSSVLNLNSGGYFKLFTGLTSPNLSCTVDANGGYFDVPALTTFELSGSVVDPYGVHGVLNSSEGGSYSGTLILAGSNSYTGGTNVPSGTIKLAGGSALPIGTDLTLGSNTTSTSGSLDLGGYNATVGSLTTQWTASDNTIYDSNTSSSSTLTFDGNRSLISSTSTFGGIIANKPSGTTGSQTVALIVSSGSLTLTSINTYSGGTTISGGALYVSNTSGSGTGSGGVTLNGGTLGGTGTISGTVTAGSSAHTINAGATGSGSIGTLTMDGLTTNTNTTLAFDLTSPGGTSSVNDVLNVTGSNGLTLNGGTLQITSNPTGSTSLGYYAAIAYSGSIEGTGTSSITLPAASDSGHVIYTLDVIHDSGYVDIHLGYIGDADDDGDVGLSDLNIVMNHLGENDSSWSDGNFDGAATIDLPDLNDVYDNLGPDDFGDEDDMAMSGSGLSSIQIADIEYLEEMTASFDGVLTPDDIAELRAYADTIPGYPGGNINANSMVMSTSSEIAVPEPTLRMLLAVTPFLGIRRRRINPQ